MSIEVEDTVDESTSMSMDDSIRETLRSLQSNDKPEEVVTEEVVPDTTQARDTSGKFIKDEVVPEVVDTAPAVEAPVAEATSDFPNTWKKEVRDAWAKADPAIRAEVARREADILKGIEKYKAAADFSTTMENAIAPYAQTLRSINKAPEAAVRELLAADHSLRTGTQQQKEMNLVHIASLYGIDLGNVVHNMQNTDPRVYELAQRNQQLEQYMQQQQFSAQKQVDDSLNSEIANFAADPKHTHFEAVKSHMAALLQAGQAKDLSDAYDQALYANPVTRAAVLQQQAQAQREEFAKKAQAAKAASTVNLRSRPAMPISTQAHGTMEDTIRETLRHLQQT